MTHPQPTDLYQKIVDSISATLNMPTSVWAPDAGQKNLKIAAAVGLPARYIAEATLPMDGTSVTVEAFLTGEVTSTRDILHDERWQYKDTAREMGWKSALCVPVKTQGRPIAAISIYAFVNRDFSDLEKRLLSDYAEQIESRLESEQRRNTLTRLLDISDNIQQSITLQPKQLLQMIVDGACEVVGADCAVLYPYDAHREDFYDIDSVAHSGLREPLNLTEKPRKQGMADLVQQQGEIIVADIDRRSPDLANFRFIQREEIKAFVGIALHALGETRGILYVNFRTPRQLPPEDLQIIQLFARQASAVLQNAHFIEHEQALQGIARELSSQLDVNQLLNKILTQALTLLGCPVGSIAIWDAKNSQLIYRYAIGKEIGSRVEVDKGLMSAAATSRQIVNVGDVKQDARYIPRVAETQSELDVPLIVGNELLGVLNLESARLNAFGAHDEQLARAFASQAAVALFNARLFEQTQRQLEQRVQDLQALQDVYGAVGQEPVETVFRLVLERTVNLTDASYSNLWLVDQKQHDLVFGDEINRRPSPARKGARTPIDAASINGYVALTGRPYLCADVTQDEHYQPILEGVRSELTVPLRRDSRVIGTLNVESVQPAAFTDDHRRLLEALAGQAAIAIEDAHLYERLQTLIKVGQELTHGSRLTESEVLDLIRTQADQLMDAGNMYIALYDEASDTVRFGLAYVNGERIDVEHDPRWQPRKAGQGRSEAIIRGKQPIFTATRAESEAWYQQPEHKEYVGNALASWMGVPMIVGEKVIGVIAVYHPTIDNVYTAEDLRILEALANQAAIAFDNSRMFYRVNQRLGSLVEFARGISQSSVQPSEEQQRQKQTNEMLMLDLVHNEADPLMDVDNMFIALHDEANQLVRFGLAYVDGRRVDVEHDPSWQPRKAGQGRTEEIIRTRQPILINTLEESKAWYAQRGRQEYTGRFFASWLGVPMPLGNKVVGVIATYAERNHAFSGDDQAILQAMASQTAIALENIRVLNHVNLRLKALIGFGQILASGIALSESGLLELIRAQATQLMDADNMSIALYDEAADTLRFGLAYVDGQRIDIASDPRWQLRRAGKGRSEQIVRTKQPLLQSTQAEALKWYQQPGHEEYIGDRHASWLGVPMMSGDKTLGVIATYHPALEYAYNQDDLDILKALGDEAAIALDNARLLEETQRLSSEKIANQELVALGTVMATIQHRINNSFNVIVPNVLRLRKRVDLTDATIVEILDIIERNAHSTSMMINRLQEPLQATEEQTININALIDEVAGMAKEAWRGTLGAEVNVRLSLGAGIPLFTAPIGQLTEVFRNLLDNARTVLAKRESNRQILVATRYVNDTIEARVEDNGPGIPPPIRERLFTKPVTSKEQSTGAGLGLWLTRLILQRIGGDIRIEHTDESGTSMLVSIPVSQSRQGGKNDTANLNH